MSQPFRLAAALTSLVSGGIHLAWTEPNDRVQLTTNKAKLLTVGIDLLELWPLDFDAPGNLRRTPTTELTSAIRQMSATAPSILHDSCRAESQSSVLRCSARSEKAAAMFFASSLPYNNMFMHRPTSTATTTLRAYHPITKSL